ncbi:MAG: GNAT family N-acetyltransferase [Paracoccaceae bacterium]|uniref:GNAT family N-acetyltransferase n=1 Tax=Seohaeicola saemankumensis TaxID=481181 RepID=UPI001E5119CA|nr:GNAT family N-acetyltransferase [Seohaeicola saemankumensis]MCD1628113.1 GNAT family N-acetyltransferase [Seohaeicola saemankumensis]
MEVVALTGAALDSRLEDVARLRIDVFRDWPYLYDGNVAYERDYLAVYRDNPRAVVVGAFDGPRLVGAATGMPMQDHADDFAAAFAGTGKDLRTIFYCAESVLMPQWRGYGIGHRFFDLREAHARTLGLTEVAFCAVIRPADHPMRPADYAPLDPFWHKRGYQPLTGVVAHFGWKDLGDAEDSRKSLQFWSRQL